MPTQTFYNLAKEKQDKFLKAAADEFSKVSYENVSINQIIKNADISRGSFYTYFTGKEELIIYLLQDYFKAVKSKVSELIETKQGDIFKIYISLFEYIINNYIYIEKKCFVHNVMTSMKFTANEDNNFSIKNIISLNIKFMDKIDKSILNISKKNDIECIFEILMAILKHSIIEACVKEQTSEEACIRFKEKINILERGLRKEGI